MILLTSCKYGSLKQAFDACKEWSEKGDKYSISYSSGSYEMNIRECTREDETKQFLGLEHTNIEPKLYGRYENLPSRDTKDAKVKKRFKY